MIFDTNFTRNRRGGQSPLVRTPSPRRGQHLHHDIGFSDTVSNVVEIVKEEHRRGRPYGTHGNRYPRGRNHYIHFTVSAKNWCCVLQKRTFFLNVTAPGVEFAVVQEQWIFLPRSHRDCGKSEQDINVYINLEQTKPTKTKCFSYQILFIHYIFEQNNISYIENNCRAF
jgi:hypothetical protein